MLRRCDTLNRIEIPDRQGLRIAIETARQEDRSRRTNQIAGLGDSRFPEGNRFAIILGDVDPGILELVIVQQMRIREIAVHDNDMVRPLRQKPLNICGVHDNVRSSYSLTLSLGPSNTEAPVSTE